MTFFRAEKRTSAIFAGGTGHWLLIAGASVTIVSLFLTVASPAYASESTSEPIPAATSSTVAVPNPVDTSTPETRTEVAPEFVAAPTEEPVTPFIVGGTTATIGDAPWQVGLLSTAYNNDFDNQFCGGSLIATDWVVTAAHCVVGRTTTNTKVLMGKTYLSTTSTNGVSIKAITIHPSYNASNDKNDIALIQLSSPASLSAGSIATIPLATSTPGAGTSALITGWGRNSRSWNTDTYPDRLYKGTVNLISDATCANNYPSLGASEMLCAGTSGYLVDTCQGDSGGPLAVNVLGTWTLVGITSFGIGCADYDPGVYAEVATYKAWVEANANAPSLPAVTSVVPVINRAAFAKVGTPLTVTTGTWGPGVVSLAYSWKSGSDVVGSGTSYTPTTSDTGKTIRVEITGSQNGYSAVTATSVATRTIPYVGKILGGSASITAPTSILVGSALTANPGTWRPGTVTLSYQWKAGTRNIGTNSSRYVVKAADGGTRISVVVTASKAGYASVSRTSAATTVVAVMTTKRFTGSGSVTCPAGSSYASGGLSRFNDSYSFTSNGYYYLYLFDATVYRSGNTVYGSGTADLFGSYYPWSYWTLGPSYYYYLETDAWTPNVFVNCKGYF